MEEKKPLKIKFKTAVILIIILVLLLGVCGANIYASANGYGNVFFLIKCIFTGERIKDINDKQQVENVENALLTTNEVNSMADELENNNQYSNITLEGRYAIEYTDVIYTFSKNGEVKRSGNITEEIGTYKITKDKIIEIQYTNKIIYDDITNKVDKKEINEVEKLKFVNENLLTSTDGEDKYIKLNEIEEKDVESNQNQTSNQNQFTTSNNAKTEYEKAVEAIKSKLLDKNWLKENTLIKSANGNSSSIDEQVYKFAVIKEQDTKNPVVVLVVTAEKILTKNTFVIRYKNNDVSIEKVSEGHYQHTDTLTNGEYYATTYTHMKEWAYELLEVSSNDIGVIDRSRGTIGDGDYDYMDVLNFENRNNLKYVTTELNENNLNRFLNS